MVMIMVMVAMVFGSGGGGWPISTFSPVGSRSSNGR